MLKRIYYITSILALTAFTFGCAPLVKISQSDNEIYQESLQKILPENIHPKTFGIDPSIVDKFRLEMANLKENDTIKTFLRKEFAFVLNHVPISSSFEKVNTKTLFENTKSAPLYKNNDTFYHFSPIIYSSDNQRAFLISQQNTINNASEPLYLLFKKDDGKWVLFYSMIPYIY